MKKYSLHIEITDGESTENILTILCDVSEMISRGCHNKLIRYSDSSSVSFSLLGGPDETDMTGPSQNDER